jgi:18S rRNA (guanine1575-N7)-methyltransferase
MTRKNSLPRFPDDYIGERAKKYDNLTWMERNQRRTTLRCVQYLFDPKLGECEKLDYSDYLILDLGCGTGFSTEELLNLGFNVVGIDILEDMLMKAYQKKSKYNFKTREELILASILNLPIKPEEIDFIISISAYNFITYEKTDLFRVRKILNETARQLFSVLKKKGRAVIEFYPQNQKELKLYLDSFRNNSFTGFFIKDNPQQKGGQTFLLLKKEME